MRNTIKIRLPEILLGLFLFFTACENDVVTANLDKEIPPFQIEKNAVLGIVDEAVAHSSIGMLFDIRKGAEIAFEHFLEPSETTRCGKVFTTNLSQPYSYRLLGFDSDFHVEILCSPYWSIEAMKVSTHVKPDYTTAETEFTSVEAFGKWTIDKVAENVEAYPVTGYYIRNGIWRYGTKTHERYNYHFRIDIDDLSLMADNYDFEEPVTATFDLKVTSWSATGEEEKDFVEGTILFNTNGMFFVSLNGHDYAGN